MAKSKSSEFYSFDEVLRQLNIDEARLKRLVSEGELRAFREGDQMRFRRSEIDSLAGRTGRGGTADTSLTEISLEDESQPTISVGEGAGETLHDDFMAEPEPIASQETVVDRGEDVGMSTEPIDFTEEEPGEEPEEIEDIGAERVSRRGAVATTRRRVVVAEPSTNPLLVLCLVLGLVVSVLGAFTAWRIARWETEDVTRGLVKVFAPDVKLPEMEKEGEGD